MTFEIEFECCINVTTKLISINIIIVDIDHNIFYKGFHETSEYT